MKISRYRRDGAYSYTLGATLTFELLKMRSELVRRVFFSPDCEQSESIRAIAQRCGELGIAPEVSAKPFNVLSPKGNCYVIAEFEKFGSRLQPGSHIVLVQPSDAGNIGTILRTAAGFGYRDIGIVRPAVDVFDPKAVRASMGALFHHRVEYFDDIDQYLARFGENERFAFMLTGSILLQDVQVPEKPHTLLFGNEATGLPDVYAQLCTAVRIPHSDAIDSLNLPIAAGIGMYTFVNNAEFTAHIS